MKRLLFIMLIISALGGTPLRAQNLAQMATQQIEKSVDLPAIVVLRDSSWIERFHIDQVIMKLPVKRNGRIAVLSIEFINPSIEPINDLFLYAARQVKLPKEFVVKNDMLTVRVQLAFKKMSPSSNHSQKYIQDGRPAYYYDHSVKRGFYQREMENRPGRIAGSTDVVMDVNEVLTAPIYRQSEGVSKLPRYRVTLVKSK